MDCHGGAALARGLMSAQMGAHQMTHDWNERGEWHDDFALGGEFAAPSHADFMTHAANVAQRHVDPMGMMEQPEGLQEFWDASTGAAEGAGWLAEFEAAAASEWVGEFVADEVQHFGVEGEPILSVEEKTRQSEFYRFMRQVRSGELRVNDALGTVEPVDIWGEGGVAREAVEANSWASEFVGYDNTDADLMAWADAADFGDRDFAEEYLAEEGSSWANEYLQRGNAIEDYPFDPNNPFLFHDDPYLEGLSLLASGSLAEAVLALEAAVQKDPDRDDLWRTLGTTQAENEKDSLAIRALVQARKRNPHDPSTHLALAVSHTNECNHHQALDSLKTWLLCQPPYERLADVVTADEEPTTDETYFFVSPSEHRHVVSLFEAATELNPHDADLYVAQGVLRNLSHEYTEAAGSFRTALQIRPDDAKLWNKLGATLANGSRSDEALEAYDRALDLCPGFVRARYNMGIAHSNLGNHRAAAEHLLRAIVMQQGGTEVPDPPTRSTRELWDVLRINLSVLNRTDLIDLTYKQDVRPLLAEFGLHPLM